MKLSCITNCRLLLVLAIGLAFSTNTHAQCTFGSEYLTQEQIDSDPATDTATDDLPADLLGNLRLVGNFFALNPEFRIYKETENSGAKTYCSCQTPGCTTSIVFVGKKLITEYDNGFSDKDGLWGLIAHEVAHAYQCSLGITGSLAGVQRELHADFLAGYFLGRKRQVALTNIRQFADELFKRGDFAFNDAQHHGTPEERVRMMLIGASLSILTLNDASIYGYRLLTGQAGSYNILGNWAPNQNLQMNSPFRLNIFAQGNTMGYQQFNAANGQATSAPIFAGGMGLNQYRIVWQPTPQMPQGLVQDFFVIDNSKIVVMYSTGAVEIWIRT